MQNITPKVDIDEFNIVNIDLLEFNKGVEEISLWGNKIADYEKAVKKLKALPNLKAVWFNENPISDLEDFTEKLYKEIPNLQIVNKELTPSSTEWVLQVLCRDKPPIPIEETLTLDLAGRKIEYFKPEWLLKLPKLKEIDITDQDELVKILIFIALLAF